MCDENKVNSMTIQKTFKKQIRARMDKTKESFSVARAMLLRSQPDGSVEEPQPSDAIPAGVTKTGKEVAADPQPLSAQSTADSDLVPYYEIDLDQETESQVETEAVSGDDGSTEDESGDHEMEWEFRAREAVEKSLQDATFEIDEDDESVVTLPNPKDGHDYHSSGVECRSVKGLVDELRERAEAAWYGYVPWDGGAAFEFPGDDLIYAALSEYEDELDKLGWEM